MRCRLKQKYIELLTFDEAIEYGNLHTEFKIDGIPSGFEYNNCLLTYNSDEDCYVVSRSHRCELRMNREELLAMDGPYNLTIFPPDMFMYEKDVEFELVQIHENVTDAEIVIRSKDKLKVYAGNLKPVDNPESYYPPKE